MWSFVIGYVDCPALTEAVGDAGEADLVEEVRHAAVQGGGVVRGLVGIERSVIPALKSGGEKEGGHCPGRSVVAICGAVEDLVGG